MTNSAYLSEGKVTNPSTNSELGTRQAVELALRVMDGDWVVAVLAALAAGPLHTVELVNAINAIEARVGRHLHDKPATRQGLAPTLKRMTRTRLIVRTQDPTPHPSVWYRLTPAGRSLLAAVVPLADWARSYQRELLSTGEDGASSVENEADSTN